MYLSKPTVCKVRGAAMAGGCGLVAAADFAIAADNARFGLPEVKIGLFPAQILPAVVRAVGRRHALDLALTGRTISALEAQEIGLINRAVSPSLLDEEVASLVEELASVGPLTMAMGKRAFNQLTELNLRDGLEAARDLRLPFLGSPELRSGIEAFMSRRDGAELKVNR
jgi:methylglutaconyl-CoA hydratase